MSHTFKPLIGLSVNVSPPDDPKRSFSKGVALQLIQQTYLNFVETGGGTPVLLPVIRDLDQAGRIVERLDGLILIGGVDVDPALYGEENTHSLGVDRSRDDFEIRLVHEARALQLPLLCICRGIQILNVALDGSLYQDIPTSINGALKHTRKPEDPETFHLTRSVGDSFLNEIFDKAEFRVNSSHHQSVKEPGKGLKIVSCAPDGVVEAVQHVSDRCTVGIQWHPERLPDEPEQVGIARWFVGQL
jgi:putative glutamine amidotransferase